MGGTSPWVPICLVPPPISRLCCHSQVLGICLWKLRFYTGSVSLGTCKQTPADPDSLCCFFHGSGGAQTAAARAGVGPSSHLSLSWPKPTAPGPHPVSHRCVYMFICVPVACMYSCLSWFTRVIYMYLSCIHVYCVSMSVRVCVVSVPVFFGEGNIHGYWFCVPIVCIHVCTHVCTCVPTCPVLTWLACAPFPRASFRHECLALLVPRSLLAQQGCLPSPWRCPGVPRPGDGVAGHKSHAGGTSVPGVALRVDQARVSCPPGR